MSEHWHEEPEDKCYFAALNYLTLIMPLKDAEGIVSALKLAPKRWWFPAKDILRASGLPLLPKKLDEVDNKIEKLEDGTKMNPVLLVRGQPLIIADGYHRVCAAYYYDIDTMVPCRII